MSITQKIINKYNKIPSFLFYNEFAELLEIKIKEIFSIEDSILDAAEEIALNSPRKRFIIALHNSLEETAHRMINTMAKGTFASPHMHDDPNTSEELVALRGSACVIEFSDDGKIINRLPFGESYNTNLIEIKPNSIHTVIPLTKTVTLFEVKGQTSYNPSKDKFFYPWAPKEGDDPKVINKYLKLLENEK